MGLDSYVWIGNAAREENGQAVVGLDQWAVGQKETHGKEGTWRDAEDGFLSGNAVIQGSVDSTVALHLTVPAGGQAAGWYWIAVGREFAEVTRLNRSVRQKGPATFLDRTRDYWNLWGISEQVHPYINAPLSVSPLTWSHAALVYVVREYVSRWLEIE